MRTRENRNHQYYVIFDVEFNGKKTSVAIFPVFSIAPGESVDIYAMNYSTDAVAQVTIPPTAQGFVPGGERVETFKLIPPFLSGALIGPFVPKAPPAPPPSSPSEPLPPTRSLRGKQGKRPQTKPRGLQ